MSDAEKKQRLVCRALGITFPDASDKCEEMIDTKRGTIRWDRVEAMGAFCSGIPTDQLTPGGLRKLVGAARRAHKSLFVHAPHVTTAELYEALAPFKGGDDAAGK